MTTEPTTNTAQLAVDPISAASPDMSDADFKALCESIRTQGQLVPVVVRDGQVIDGRKRLAACATLGLTPRTISLASDADPTAAATALNLLRTHYTASQRGMFISKLATLTKVDAGKIRQKTAERNNAELTHDEAARIAGVQKSLIVTAKLVRRDGEPEVVQAVERGDLTLHAAKQIVGSVPRDEQSAVVARIIQSKTPGGKNVAAKVLGHVPARRAIQPKPVTEALTRLFRQLTDSMDVLQQYADAPFPDWDTRRVWVRQIRDAMRELRRYKRRLEEEK